jgi:hypothetical protein
VNGASSASQLSLDPGCGSVGDVSLEAPRELGLRHAAPTDSRLPS